MSEEKQSPLGKWNGYYSVAGSRTATRMDFEITAVDSNNQVRGFGSDGTPEGHFELSGTFQFSRFNLTKKSQANSSAEEHFVGDLSIDLNKIIGTWWSEVGTGTWYAHKAIAVEPSNEQPHLPNEHGTTLFDLLKSEFTKWNEYQSHTAGTNPRQSEYLAKHLDLFGESKNRESDDENSPLLGAWKGEMTRTGSKVHTKTTLLVTKHDGLKVEGTGNDGGRLPGDFDFSGTFQFSRLTFAKTFKTPGTPLVDCVADLSIDESHLTGSWQSEEGDGSWRVQKAVVEETTRPFQEAPLENADLLPQTDQQTAPRNPSPSPQIEAQPPESTVPEPIDSPANGNKCTRCGAARSGFSFCTNCGHAYDLS